MQKEKVMIEKEEKMAREEYWAYTERLRRYKCITRTKWCSELMYSLFLGYYHK